MLTEDRNRSRDLPERRDDFLSRVETLCRHHESGATVEVFPARKSAGSYLRVTRLKGKDVFPVGAVEHGLSRESLQAFVDQVDHLYRKHDAGLISVLVYGGARAPEHLLREAEGKRIHLVSFVEYRGLIDFRAYLDRQVRGWLRSPLGRFIVLLGDFGTGKTFLL